MSRTNTITMACNDGVSTLGGTGRQISNDGQITISTTIGHGQTNKLLEAFAFKQAKLKSIYILVASGGVNLTLKTNSSGSPQETITLKPGQPLVWNSDDGYFTCPFSGDVTAGYFTNSDGAIDDTLDVRAVLDPT